MFSNIHTQELPNDVLKVTGMNDKTGELVTAYGWISATTNHYSPEDYDDGGHVKEGAKYHTMTKAELNTYCESLLAGVKS